MRRAVASLFMLLALACGGAQAQQDQAAQLQSLQQQAERTRANAAEYRANADAYRRLSREAQEQAQRADEALALAIARGNEESRSYWERQTRFWRERMELHKEEIARNEAKAEELERSAAEIEAQIARARAAPPVPAPRPTAATPPSAPVAEEKYRRRELAEFVGLWRDKQNNVEGVIEGVDPADPTVGTDITFKGRQLTWEGTFDGGGGENPAKLTFRYTPKWQEMNEEIPDWARRKVEGTLKWKLVLDPPDDEYACVLPTLKATWHAGEVTWEGDADSGTAQVTGEGEAQKFELDKEDDEIELHGYFNPALLLHVGEPQRAMTDPVVFLVQGQRFHVEVHMSKEAARAHSPTAGPAPGPGIGGYVFDRDYAGAPATVVFRGLSSGKTARLDLRMALQTRNHPVVRYETREPVTITDLWGVENKINVEFDNGETVEASFGEARQQFRFFTSVTKLKLAARDEAFQHMATLASALLSGKDISASQRRQADNVLKLVRNARAFIHDVPVYLNENSELHGLHDRARLAIADKYYHWIILGPHKQWYGIDGMRPSPDNPFGIRWASVEEQEAVYEVMKSPDRKRELLDMASESGKAGANAAIGLYTTISYAGLAIAFHATPVGEAYLAWYGEDLYGNRVDITERVSAAFGFGISVVGFTATVASALTAVRDAGRLFTVEKAAEVEALVEASAGAASGQRRVVSGAEAARPAASAPGTARRRVLRTEESADITHCLPDSDNLAEAYAEAATAVERIRGGTAARPPSASFAARELARAKEVHRDAELLDAPAELHSFRQVSGECRLRSVDALEQFVRKHKVNPRADMKIAQTRRNQIPLPGQTKEKVWNPGQQGGASAEQVRTYAATDLRARFYSTDLPLADVADLYESGFGVTFALELQHVSARHQVALYAVEYGPLGRFLRRPKSFTVFDTNFPTKLFKYKACDLDRLLLRALRPGETRQIGRGVITADRFYTGRRQGSIDLFQFE